MDFLHLLYPLSSFFLLYSDEHSDFGTIGALDSRDRILKDDRLISGNA